MTFYHVNPATGIVISCGGHTACALSLPLKAHYSTFDAALAAFDAERSNNCFLQRKSFNDEKFSRALEDAAEGGFVRASREYPQHFDAQVEILYTPTALSYIADKVSTAFSEHQKKRYARTLAWVVHKTASGNGGDLRRTYKTLIEPLLRTKSAASRVLDALGEELPSEEELVSVAGSLWLYRDSTFHTFAKALQWSEPLEISGYIPQREKDFVVEDHSLTLEKMGVKSYDLVDHVIAFDIETDTQRGYGLRPTKTQITEVVLTSRERSWVISGDEKFILEQFAKVLNEQDSRVVLAGWNNWSFDNIVLQTRAEYHKTPGWGGFLKEAANATVFEPVGPTGETQSLTWTTPDGHVLHDLDIFQEKVLLDQARGERYTPGLKPFVESLNVTPIKLDRQRLHEYTPQNRRDYVLSDGISTLRALTEVRRLQALEDRRRDEAL